MSAQENTLSRLTNLTSPAAGVGFDVPNRAEPSFPKPDAVVHNIPLSQSYEHYIRDIPLSQSYDHYLHQSPLGVGQNCIRNDLKDRVEYPDQCRQ
jgi:hypothetical protein